MDDKMKLIDLRQRLEEFVQERDWEQFHNPKDLAVSLVLEASELLEIFQWKRGVGVEHAKENEKMHEKIKEELADVVMYSFMLANRLDIDISDIIINKLEKVVQRYPADVVKGKAKDILEIE